MFGGSVVVGPSTFGALPFSSLRTRLPAFTAFLTVFVSFAPVVSSLLALTASAVLGSARGAVFLLRLLAMCFASVFAVPRLNVTGGGSWSPAPGGGWSVPSSLMSKRCTTTGCEGFVRFCNCC